MRRPVIQIDGSGSSENQSDLDGKMGMPIALGRRRFLSALVPFALLAPRSSWAAASRAPARIGWLKIQGPRHTAGQLRAFRTGMRALGLVEGRDYVLEERYAYNDGSRLPRLTAELLASGVRIIVATSQPSIVAAAHVTKGVPVIGRMNDDPVANGMARSLAQPGGNITGIYAMTEELNSKRLALLKEVAPSAHLVGVLLRRDWSRAAHDWEVLGEAARRLKVELVAFDVHSAADLNAAFEQAAAKKVNGVMTFRNPTVVTHLKLISELTQKYRLPSVFDAREYVEAGALMSYGPNIDAIYTRLATYADRLLRGSPAGDLPIERPTIFELVINKQAADAIGVVLPADLVTLADKVIE